MAWNLLKKAGIAAGKMGLGMGKTYVATNYPFLVPLAGMIDGETSKADREQGIRGPEKKERVMGQLDVNGDTILALIEKSGLVVADPNAFWEGTGQLVDAIHKIKKSCAAADTKITIPAGASLELKGGRIVGWNQPKA